MPVHVTRGAMIAHRYTHAHPGSKTSQYRRSFIVLSESLCNNLGDPVFNGVDWRVSRAWPMLFLA